MVSTHTPPSRFYNYIYYIYFVIYLSICPSLYPSINPPYWYQYYDCCYFWCIQTELWTSVHFICKSLSIHKLTTQRYSNQPFNSETIILKAALIWPEDPTLQKLKTGQGYQGNRGIRGIIHLHFSTSLVHDELAYQGQECFAYDES